ncbi:MAG: hypothetical protein ACRD2Z_08720 [Thermoanaerobaculia bacterium]
MSLRAVSVLALALAGCSEGTPPSAPPPLDAGIAVAFSSVNAADHGLAEIVIEVVGVTALSDGGANVELGGAEDDINLVAIEGAPIDLVSGEAAAGEFTGLRVELAEEGFVRETPGSLSQDLVVTQTTVTASGAFTVDEDAVTELELIMDLAGRLTFDDTTDTWRLDPRNLDLLN